MKSKMKACPVCGKEMAAGAKSCPSCGAKNKKPLWKKWWFWVLAVLVVGIAAASAGGGNAPKEDNAPDASTSVEGGKPGIETDSPEESDITYTSYTAGQLMEDLNANALKAKDTYEDQYIELSGVLNVIDSSGKYISLRPAEDEYAIIGIQCYLQSEDQKAQVMELSIGDPVTVQGKITDVGEVLGYSMDIDAFVP